MRLVENDDVIQTIPSYRTDHAFHERALPRRARRCYYCFDAHTLHTFPEHMAINTISVPQQITRSCIERKSLHDLLRCPLHRGMFGDIEVHNVATVMTEDNENIENTKGCGRNRKEID